MSEINFDTSAYDERQEEEELTQQLQEAEAEREAAAAQEEDAKATPQPTEKKEEGEFLGGMMEDLGPSYAEQGADGKITTDEMGGKQRAVAGTIDTVMDLTSKFLPFMQQPADYWDEASGRKEPSDPLKKAERDMSAIIMPMLLTGGYVSGASKAAGLTGKTKLLTEGAVNFGLDALISGTSDTTSEAGNLGSLLEQCSTIWYEDSVGIT